MILLSSGCQSAKPINPVTGADNSPTLTSEVPQPETQFTTTPTLPTETPTATAVPTSQIFEAEVAATTLNMRSGPSVLHNIINQYQKGDVVTVIARAPGNEWVKVLTKDKKSGWMVVSYLTLKQDIGQLPIYEINESLVVKGRVVNASGTGIPGVQVGVTRLGGAARVRVDGISLPDGTFYAYAPAEYQGTWLASIVSVDCKSPIVDVNCRYAGIFEPTAGINLTLPTSEEILFTYK
jgi:SH3-like domain-containing protein